MWRNKGRWIALVFWLGVWQIVSRALGQEILLVSPFRVLVQTVENLGDIAFYHALWSTTTKITLGFVLGSMGAIVLAFSAHFFVTVQMLLSPFVRLLKTVPVVSFIILALVFVSPNFLGGVISAMVVFPLVYLQIEAGLLQIDHQLLEMAKVFHFSTWKKIRYIYLDGLRSALRSSLETGMGMAWKSGLAAEVIALPKWGIGTNLYNAKIYLDMANLFSYTLVAVLLSFGLEKLLRYLLGRLLWY